MYLIDVETHTLKEFIGNDVPPYAILSHRWGPDELTFKEVLKQRAKIETRGYQKLVQACEVAKHYEVQYIWIDTCCIDKKSSAELSEAINSMFEWYRNARICIAFLEDIQKEDLPEHPLVESVWFTQAWTLQELLAPQELDFYDYSWQNVGSRASYAGAIAVKTRIPIDALGASGFEPRTAKWPIAVRMSWASGRQATRPEDVAYSLIGIFNINMPLLYGEGDQAFARLQEEIMRYSTDKSLLIHECGGTLLLERDGVFPDPPPSQWTRQLLAKSPDDFQFFGEHDPSPILQSHALDESFVMTNYGLEMVVKLYKLDLEAFAIIATRIAYWTYFLLLRRCSPMSPRYFYVAGSAKALTHDLLQHETWREERAITIARIPPVSLHTKTFAGIQTGFVITYAGAIDYVAPVHLPRISPKEYPARWKMCSTIDQQRLTCQRLTCKFLTGRRIGIARFTIGQPPTLWIEMCLDFDDHPCIHIRTFERALRYLSTEDISILELCDLQRFPNLRDEVDKSHMEMLEPDEGYTNATSEYKMIILPDHDSRLPTYFLRYEGRSIAHCMIPDTLIHMILSHPTERLYGEIIDPHLWTLIFS